MAQVKNVVVSPKEHLRKDRSLGEFGQKESWLVVWKEERQSVAPMVYNETYVEVILKELEQEEVEEVDKGRSVTRGTHTNQELKNMWLWPKSLPFLKMIKVASNKDLNSKRGKKLYCYSLN